jgi:hypothetical protein
VIQNGIKVNMDFFEAGVWPDELAKNIMFIVAHNDMAINKAKVFRKINNDHTNEGAKRIYLSNGLTFYHNHNPVYCGLEILRLSVVMEKAGISLANWFESVASIAHLYIAIDWKRSLQHRWPELENIIAMHISEIFSSTLPSELREMIVQFLWSMGLKATTLVSLM